MKPLIPLLLSFMVIAGSTLADSDRDHDRARDARRAGQVVPLAEILAVVERDYGGRVIEVELEKERVRGGEIWIYDIKLLRGRGDVLELEYDARTKRLLRAKGKGGRKRERRK